VRDHCVDRNDEIERLQSVCEEIDVGCADVSGARFRNLVGRYIALHRKQANIKPGQLPKQIGRNLTPLVPGPDTPDKADSERSGLRRFFLFALCELNIWTSHPDEFAISAQCMRQFHDLDIDIKGDRRRAVVKRQHLGHAGYTTNHSDQCRLAPDGHLGSNLRERR